MLVIYSAVNVFLGRSAWDPYPFILLNLILSMLAAIQAPVIMMSQNRQDTKDRLRSELDFDVNRRSEVEIQGLSRKLNLLGDKILDLEDLLRKHARDQRQALTEREIGLEFPAEGTNAANRLPAGYLAVIVNTVTASNASKMLVTSENRTYIRSEK